MICDIYYGQFKTEKSLFTVAYSGCRILQWIFRYTSKSISCGNSFKFLYYLFFLISDHFYLLPQGEFEEGCEYS